jgi:methylmalonyl-CoA mutase cobalamin-binding domain/chain
VLWDAEVRHVVGLSLLSGTHHRVAAELLALLERERADIPVVLGGIIPPRDVAPLLEAGVKGVFGPGSSTTEIVETVDRLVGREQAGAGG